MRHSSTPTGKNNGDTSRTRTRGAIRTHLGRKRTGPRTQKYSSSERAGGTSGRYHEEDLFDRLFGRFRETFQQAGEATIGALDRALDSACQGLVAAGEFTAENGERLRTFLRHDLLQRDDPALTFRTGDITSAGTLTCVGCGWTIQTPRTTVLPACPHCADTTFRKTG